MVSHYRWHIILLIMTTPLSILPKFLWKHIVDYISLSQSIVLSQVHYHFISIIDWEYCFKDKKQDDIAVVFNDGWNRNQFWYHACITYTAVSIAPNRYDAFEMFRELAEQIEKRKKDLFVDCKVFMKEGRYLFIIYDDYMFDMNYDKCNIEIIGNSDNKNRTVIYTDVCFGHRCIQIDTSSNFIIKHIDFVDMCVDLHNNKKIDNMVIIDDCSFVHPTEDYYVVYGLYISLVEHILIKIVFFRLNLLIYIVLLQSVAKTS